LSRMGKDRPILRRALPAAFLVCSIILQFMPAPFAGAADGSAPDWVVSSVSELKGTVKDLRANLIIESGGELRMTNATLVLNCSRDGEFEILVKAGGKLTGTGANITYGPLKARYWFRVSGTLELADSEVSGTRGMFDMGGIYITSSTVSLTRCHLYDHQWYALMINGSSPSISGCTIDRCRSGIKVEHGGAPTISDNTIKDNEREAITCLNSNPAIRNNRILRNWRGIGLFESEPEISGNEITGQGQLGIECTDFSDATITGNTITGSGEAGISVVFSSPKIISNTISSNGVGINSTTSKVTIEKNTISGNRGWGIFAKGGKPSLNGNKYQDNAGNGNALGALAIVWALSVKVVDSENKPVDGATVTVTDKAGKTVFKGVTGNDGFSSGIELFQSRTDNNGQAKADTPHKVTVRWKDLSDSQTISIDKDQLLTANLGKQPRGFLPGADLPLTVLAVGLLLVLWRFRR